MHQWVIKGNKVLDRKTKKEYPILGYGGGFYKIVQNGFHSWIEPFVMHKDDKGELWILLK